MIRHKAEEANTASFLLREQFQRAHAAYGKAGTPSAMDFVLAPNAIQENVEFFLIDEDVTSLTMFLQPNPGSVGVEDTALASTALMASALTTVMPTPLVTPTSLTTVMPTPLVIPTPTPLMPMPSTLTLPSTNTPCPSKQELSNTLLKAQLSRVRSHNEQTLVRPCGVIFAWATMFRAEAVSNFLIKMLNNTVSISGSQKPEHVVYNTNCNTRQQAEKSNNWDWYKNIGMCVDVWHFRNKHAVTHKYCQVNCNPAMYPELMDGKK